MIARWLANLKVFLVWLLGFVLAWIILFLGHEVLMVFIVNTLRGGQYIVPLIHILYYCTVGLLIVMVFLLSMEYLKRSAQKGMLLMGAMLSIGTELLIIALAQAILTLYGFLPGDPLGILLMAAEGLVGVGMLFLARWLNARSPVRDTKELK